MRNRFIDRGFQMVDLCRRACCSSAVMTATAPASMMRSCRLLAEKPPNTTECVAPMRAQACIATTASIAHRHVDDDAIAFADAQAI